MKEEGSELKSKGLEMEQAGQTECAPEAMSGNTFHATVLNGRSLSENCWVEPLVGKDTVKGAMSVWTMTSSIKIIIIFTFHIIL